MYYCKYLIMINLDKPQIVQKEHIAYLHFPAGEVLAFETDIEQRTYELHRVSLLGNIHHVKMKIVFEDTGWY